MVEVHHDVSSRIAFIRKSISRTLRRRGAVVQVSGGIDSALTLALCARAVGPANTRALYLPDDDTDPQSAHFAQLAAESSGCLLTTLPIGALVSTARSTTEPVRVIQKYFSDFDPSGQAYALNFDVETSFRLGTACFKLHVGPRHEAGEKSTFIDPGDLRILMAAQNVKQRLRMTIAYLHADAGNYAVVGASNADELDLGFVVKFGDAAADLFAIADLTKDDVRRLASDMRVPQEIRSRTPTTDTFGLTQSQDEYYFGIPAQVVRAFMKSSTREDLVQACLAAHVDPGYVDAIAGIVRSLSWTVSYQSAILKPYINS